MRLSDVVNEAKRRTNEVMMFVRHPFQVASQAATRKAQAWYEKINLPIGKTPNRSSHPDLDTVSTDFAESDTESIETVHSKTATALAERPAPKVIDQATLPPRDYEPLGEPVLKPKMVIKSRWNSYTIENSFKSSDGTRLYRGKTRSDEPILLKEYYLFEREFSPQEIEQRQKSFERLIELNLKVGNGPDFRIVKLVDAIVLPKENACYLITRPINHNTTLTSYLKERKTMSPLQVREVLRQVLETLCFLHEAYRVHFPSGESERGIPHGNISLNSLLIREVGISNTSTDRQFFIYLSDLELWQHLFYPPGSSKFREQIAKESSDLGTVRQDLADLGWVGFYLLGGTLHRPIDDPPNLLLDPAWQVLEDAPLKQFIRRLMGLESPFRTAEQALHEIPAIESPITIEETPAIESISEPAPLKSVPLMLLALLSLGLLGLLSWFVVRQITIVSDLPAPPVPQTPLSISRIRDVRTVPRTLTYLIEPDGGWNFALARTFRSCL